MKVEFIRFKATDTVELRGWLTNEDSTTAVIHVHGMSGNGYENHFLDFLREMFTANNLSFFTFDNRGSGIMNSFWMGGAGDAWGEGTKLGGSCYEIFEESIFDIEGAIDLLSSYGKSKFILMGHSLGGSKVVNYLVNKNPNNVTAAILLAPTDMIGWAKTDKNHQKYLEKGKALMAKNAGEKLVGMECWLDKTPISAQTYSTICEAGKPVDIYNEKDSPLGRVETPLLIAYGDSDIGIVKIDGSIEKYITRVNKIKNKNTFISVIKGASHSFKGYENKLTEVVGDYFKNKF